ncbi:protein bicaudal C [Toxorhynchites rutilus septentrionalis]|uniref:protein bicaudal C n=1 Tax=Toxorhynchites rutilus septentrionalis TaxID=329112 RepID=UPI0024784971|nr:protein bicaudal C [Toxorhynchites rutilus septentrionalis]XP_055643770.1 protein bicaudal C [Toxorhynchites rutilus septentrionalis]XP_055643772.1 protein bicaudal C [Toxorhynchites rutilus septentrionalis]XP_055643773.1 protein bicaudal C [Toxorhynchites rutilus septentrionalis]
MMTSCPPFNKHIFINGGPPSETTGSEISSVESDWGDLRLIAAQLGVANPDDLHVERFKVDRLKLEDMIKVETYSEGMNSAEEFFTNIMKETTTYVSWPCRLKIGAKTKKDPHIRIVGKMADVLKAKDKVMARLDSRGSRVIMKMDVSYTDHSFIIGRGGNNIKRIMEETATHIHFPDSNRSNPTEKSNQVSLCGSLEGVERARALVRISTPLLISFELPILAPGKTPPDNDTPYVKEVEREFNVQVIFSTRPKLHSSLVLVKGAEKEEQKVKEATRRLMEFMCENIASQIPVQMQLEISTQHHPIVLGRASSNLREIMSRTGTQIMFPDANDVNIKPIKRSQVTITGSINGVYLARQQLIGSLPIALIFDYPENTVDSEEITKLMYAHDVFISVRQKSRQSTLCIVIKGIEKFISNIYEARYHLLKCTASRVVADIPRSYLGPNEQAKNSQNVSQLLAGPAPQPFSPLSPINPMPFATHNWPSPTPPAEFALNQLRNQFQNFNLGPTKMHHPLAMPPGLGNFNNNVKPQLHPSLNTSHGQTLLQVPGQHHTHHSLSGRSSSSSGSASCASIPCQNTSNSSAGGDHSSGYHSLNCSNTSLDQQLHLSNTSMPGSSGSGSNSMIKNSPDNGGVGGIALNRCRHMSYSDSPQYQSDLVDQRTPMAYEQKSTLNDTFVFNFDPRVVAGYKAMHIPPQQGELRTPTPSWQGLGLSQTSPVPLEACDLSWANSSGSSGGGGGGGSAAGSDSRLNMTTTMIEVTPMRQREQLSQYNDVTSILTSLGLEHYIKNFINGEIDMTVFQTLTDQDLLNLDIKPLGARRKILMAIHDLYTRQHGNPFANMSPASSSSSMSRFSGSAAPGAERRTSSGQ